MGERRGLLLGSLLGAIVSSTAVTVALARRREEVPAAMAGAAALAAAVSISRVCLIILVVAPTVLPRVAAPAMAAALVFASVGGLLMFRRQPVETETMRVRNPFDLAPLLGFAASFAVIAALNAYLTHAVSVTGMLAASAASGLLDVDVAVLSAVRQLGVNFAVAPIDVSNVADAVLMALLANAAGRTLLAGLVGNPRFLGWIASITLVAGGVGTAIHAL